jgi:hypothetical protein
MIGVSNTGTVIYLFNYYFEKLVLIMISFLVLIRLFASLLKSIACSQLLKSIFPQRTCWESTRFEYESKSLTINNFQRTA